MKLNWGHAITIVIVLFMITFTTAFIMSLGHNNDLVTEGYYEKELLFQDEILKKENAQKDQREIQYSFSEKEMEIILTGDQTLSKGQILLYRADDKNADITLKMNQPHESRTFRIPFSNLSKGKYIIKADWKEDGKSYLVHQTVFVP